MSVTRRALLAGGLAALAWPSRARASSPKYLITVLAEGGWDVSYCLDPKLGVDTVDGPEWDESGAPDDVEAIRTFGGLDIVCNDVKRPSVTGFFERWGAKSHVVRGIWMGAIAHDPCRFRILTGTPTPLSADVATIAGSALASTEPLGALDLSGWSLAGPLAASTGRIGHQSQIKALVDPKTVLPPPVGVPWVYPLFSATNDDQAEVAAYLRARASTYGAARADGGHNDQRIADLLQARDRAGRLRTDSAELLDSLVLGKQPDLELQVSIAVDLLQAGLCRTITLSPNYRWDTHEFNVTQHGNYQDLFEKLDQLATLLDARGMLDQTLVNVVSEMTRTPKLNSSAGKDHWPHTSALLFGGGIRGGAVSGSSDDVLTAQPMDLRTGAPQAGGDLLKYDNLAAGLLTWMGVDPGEWLPGVEPFGGLAP